MQTRAAARAAMLRVTCVLGVVGAACLTRPVMTESPTVVQPITEVLLSEAVDKLDLLFMIDNSASMGDKQELLAQAVPDMIHRLVTPNCLLDGKVVGTADLQGTCATGKPEFQPVHDMHIGIVTSSLGGRGADSTCDPSASNLAVTSLPAHNDDRGELINRGGSDEHAVANAGQPLNFLAWYPDVPSNHMGDNPAPPVPAETAIGDEMTPGTLIGDFTDMIRGVHEHGCPFEAQNEAWYRFLVQPDPFDSENGIVVDPHNRATLHGYDSVILKQRAAFLRPDSLLAVIVVTDEDEEVANPLSLGGQGWLFEGQGWPQSPTATGAPEGTIECRANPLDPECISCASSNVVGTQDYATRCPADPPSSALGYLDPQDDGYNVRFFHQKQRFGVFTGYPVSRYIRGLTSATVPDRDHEVDANGNYVGDQDKSADCVNPIFAQNLPTDPSRDLCHLQRGPRTPDLVYYGVIGGVPHQLLQAKPGDPDCPAGTNAADCPQKSELADSDWLSITGKDPENYDFSGVDPHMLESESPRQTGCAPTQGDTCDPINGREWDTQKGDLQYACIFKLAQPRDCTLPENNGACDCQGGPSQNTALCQVSAGTHGSMQINGKAYPSVREMTIAHAMASQPPPVGNHAIVSSLCPIHTTPQGDDDPVFGYRPAVNAIVDRLKTGLEGECLPQRLNVDSVTGEVPCLVLATLSHPGGEDVCDSIPGLARPQGDILAAFQTSQHQAWVDAGGNASAQPDPRSFPTCKVTELTPSTDNGADFGPDGTCAASPNPGWCYVESNVPKACPQQILFTTTMPPHGATVTLQCLEHVE